MGDRRLLRVKTMEITSIKIGDKLTSASGVEIEILNIEILGIHLPTPQVMVTYGFDDNTRKGIETVGIKNFYNNVRS